MTTRELTAPHLGMGIDLSLEQRHPYREGKNEYERVESHRVDALDQIDVLNNPEAECEERQTALACVGETGLSINMVNLLQDIGYSEYGIVNKDYEGASARVFEREIDGRIEVLVQTNSDKNELHYCCFDSTSSEKIKETLTSRLTSDQLSDRGLVNSGSKVTGATAGCLVASVAAGLGLVSGYMYLVDAALAVALPLLGTDPVTIDPRCIPNLLFTGGFVGVLGGIAASVRIATGVIYSTTHPHNKFIDTPDYKNGFDALEAALKRPDEQNLLAENTDDDLMSDCKCK